MLPSPVGHAPSSRRRRNWLASVGVITVAIGLITFITLSSNINSSFNPTSFLMRPGRNNPNIDIAVSPFLPTDPSSIPEDLRALYIPRILHFTAKEPTPALTERIGRWKALNPTFEIRPVYDNTTAANPPTGALFDLFQTRGESEFPGITKAFTLLSRAVERADLWRYLIVYLDGGVYIDQDVEILHPFEDWAKGFSANYSTRSWGFKGRQPYAAYREPHFGWGEGSLPQFPRKLSSTDRHPSSRAYGALHSTTRHKLPALQALIGAEVSLTPGQDLLMIHQNYVHRTQFCQWAFAFAPRHPFLASLLRRTVARILREASSGRPRDTDSVTVLFRTGPGAFTDSVADWLREQSLGRTGDVDRDRDVGEWVERVEAGGSDMEGWVEADGTVTLPMPGLLRKEDVVERGFEVVGGIGFMPTFALAYREGVDNPPEDQELVLVRHLFEGSWKKG
ncbi:membrane-bound alpha-1,6- mannosyltransferase Initiation-specific [Phlyctochytrium bullatum]|nr:membrane-bound alpha-1,6- mannosyltransferase Initiation-specific [Phlyctochytrium bullatum]